MNELISYPVLAGVTSSKTRKCDVPYQSADVPLAVPLDLGDLLLVLLVLHSQVTSLHLVCLDHIAECLICLFLRCFQLNYLLQELHSLLVKEAPSLLLGFQSECSAHLDDWQRWKLLIRIGRITEKNSFSGLRWDGKKLRQSFVLSSNLTSQIRWTTVHHTTATSFKVLACVQCSFVYTVENCGAQGDN